MSFFVLASAIADEGRGSRHGNDFDSSDDDSTQHRNRHRQSHRNRHGEQSVGAVEDPTYKEQCGACHFVYQPALLPSGSWHKIISNLEDHNGNNVAIEEAAKNTIAEYLTNNAAENSSGELATLITQSLLGETPMRITEIPYIRRKHHDIPKDVFQRESVGSSSNCVACHFTAEQGIYDDDFVRIPE